jgi:transposase InsO family protein
VKRLSDLCQSPRPDLDDFARRGFARQRIVREREHLLRSNVVDFCLWTEQQGLTLRQTADFLGLSPRTLRQWQQDLRCQKLQVQPLGRPTLRSARHDRNAVLELLGELGPATGVPMLQACFPAMPRAELEDLLKRYRRVWQKRHYEALHVLRWQTPGTVWAMDFTEAPNPIDGLYRYLLAVRDLASGQQLLWLPLVHANAAETRSALEPLFVQHGTPLVLKSDNGSPFLAGDTLDFLANWGVIPLFSPPYWPRYNGAIEAGIGSLKTRTERHATTSGRATFWTCDDAAAAQAEANATARPKGPTGPTPDELWAARRKFTAEERTLFQTSVTQERTEVRVKEGWPTEGPLNDKDARTVDRQAIRRALERHGYLLYARRRLPLSVKKKKVADNT